MRRHHVLSLVALAALACPAVCAQDAAPDVPNPDEISPEIQALATDPLAGAAGFPSPVVQRKLEDSPRSPFFYALPVIGFWLILRRRNRGVRL